MMINCFWQKITLAIFIATTAFSCESTETKKIEQTQANNTIQPTPQPNVNYGELIIKEQSEYLMIPVISTEQKSDKNTNYSLSRNYEKYNLIYNFIFYHKQEQSTHILFNKKVIINAYDFLETKAVGKPPTKLWLYRVIEQDTNGDKKLNYEDAIVGYISDLSGKNLTQVTPNNHQIQNWVIIPSQNALFLKIIKDSDNDKKFTAKDKTNFLRVSLDKPDMGTEIISEKIEEESKSYISK
ncbi:MULTISPECIES: hypothetical protein [unclassified Calothrix]|uniref:hypothetical protein n=1 Tax=unclassified Calothrix TaxID=2619626 RepID=UPI001F5577F7|nr:MULTISPECIES: hypothetical protein [unclassified Calothrix]